MEFKIRWNDGTNYDSVVAELPDDIDIEAIPEGNACMLRIAADDVLPVMEKLVALQWDGKLPEPLEIWGPGDEQPVELTCRLKHKLKEREEIAVHAAQRRTGQFVRTLLHARD